MNYSKELEEQDVANVRNTIEEVIKTLEVEIRRTRVPGFLKEYVGAVLGLCNNLLLIIDRRYGRED